MEKLKQLKIAELQKLLEERGLSTHYKLKIDLVERLYGALLEEKEESDDSFEESDPEELQSERSRVEVQSGSEDLIEGSINEEVQEMAENNVFSFRDIEESLVTFNGETGREVTSWLKEFEKIATVCKWGSIQKYLYARKLLRGAARLAIECSDECDDWEKLKEMLVNEFPSTSTSLDLHRALEKRKKLTSESYLEYVYAMKEIAARGSIDDHSLTAYIIQGIPDSPSNKAILYEASTITELKKKLKAFEVMKQQTAVKTDLRFPVKQFQAQQGLRIKEDRRCFNCGVSSHVFRDCPHKDKGAKCFRCGEFGHTAPNCSAQQQSGTNIEVSEVNLIEEKKKCEEEERRIRQEEEKKKQEEEKKKQEEEKKEQEEAEKKKQEKEEKRKRQEEEKRKQEEEEKRKREKEERRKRKVEEKRKREEEEKRKWEEEEKRNRERKKEERRKRGAEEKRNRKEEERKQEEERKREEEERKREEEERKREEEEKKLEEEYKQALKEMEKRHQRKRQSLEEARRVIAEKKKRAENFSFFNFKKERKKPEEKKKREDKKKKAGRRKERGRRTEVKGRRERKKRKRKKEDRKYSWKKRKPSQNY